MSIAKHIVIAGASGFIGKNLTESYLKQGIKVTALVRHLESLAELAFTYSNLSIINAHLEDYHKISDLIQERDVDLFYYLTWSGYGKNTNDYYHQLANIKPVCDAVVQASKIGCKRFLFTSSFSEFMICEKEKLSHNDGAHCNVYGSAKHAARIMAQAVAAQNDVEFISVAFANTFGPGDKSKRSTNIIINRLLNGQALDLTEGKHLYDWNYIEDAINGLITAGEKGTPDSLYYIGNNERRPLKDIVEEVRDILAPNVAMKLGTYHEDFHVDYSCVDVHQLYRDTGYIAKWKFRDAIIATAEWVKSLQWR